MRILAVLVCWSRFGAGMVPAFVGSWGQGVLSLAFWITSVLALIGFRSRTSIGALGLVCLVTYGWLGHLQGNTNLSSHHVFAQAMLCCLIALTPCGRSFSVDRALEGGYERGPVWGQDLIRLQLTVIYLGAVYEKTALAWFDGSRMTHFAMFVLYGAEPPSTVAFEGVMVVSAVATWVIELGLAVAIWIPRARVWALVIGVVFHGLVYAFTPVATFSATMAVYLLATLDPDRVHRWMDTPVEAVRGRSLAWLVLPLALAPFLVHPRYAALEDLGRSTCQVEGFASGQSLGMAPRDRGLEGVKGWAWARCRRLGPIDLVGRCGTEEGWEPVEIEGFCEDPGVRRGTRRVSAR